MEPNFKEPLKICKTLRIRTLIQCTEALWWCLARESSWWIGKQPTSKDPGLAGLQDLNNPWLRHWQSLHRKNKKNSKKYLYQNKNIKKTKRKERIIRSSPTVNKKKYLDYLKLWSNSDFKEKKKAFKLKVTTLSFHATSTDISFSHSITYTTKHYHSFPVILFLS